MSLWNAMGTMTYTENGALTLKVSGNPLVDFFYSVGSTRGNVKKARELFWTAFHHNNTMAFKALFYARDVREGQGERSLFRHIIKDIANNEEAQPFLKRNLQWVPVFGRWDDLLCLADTPLEEDAIELIAQAIAGGSALACKWAPREKSAKRAIAKKIRLRLKMSPKEYRKHLSKYTSVVETQMCKRDWDSIEFGKLPSRAMKLYRKAFARNAPTSWQAYAEALVAGQEKVNAGAVYPHEIVRDISVCFERGPERTVLESMWENLPDYFNGSSRSILPVIDTSGSMTHEIASDSSVTCLDVSIGLGMYCSQRSHGLFRDKFITFSHEPQLQEITGSSLFDKVDNLRRADWKYSTDIEKVFDLILNSATTNRIPQSEMPETVLIISDMEFNEAQHGTTNFGSIKTKYAQHGYDMPALVFWNVQSRGDNVPVRYDESGTALVSGFSPSIMKHILDCEEITPLAIVAAVLESRRYEVIK